MKCVFTLAGNNPQYVEMTKVLVVSSYINSSLELYCLYDGDDEELVRWLQSWKVKVLPWRVTFYQDLVKCYKGTKSLQFCAGTYLCTEIALALRTYNIEDQYVLYIDTDTMILNDLRFDSLKPEYYAAPPDWDQSDWSFVSAGVMFLNVEKLFKDYPNFLAYMYSHNFDFDFAGHGGADQGAWNTFYEGRWCNLSPEFDWKPWWGFNPGALIVHFSGPKPRQLFDLLRRPVDAPDDPMSRRIATFVVNQDLDAFQIYLQIWLEYSTVIDSIP